MNNIDFNSRMFSIYRAPLIDNKVEKISEVKRYKKNGISSSIKGDIEHTNIRNMSGCQVALVFSSILLSEQGFGSFHQGTAASVDCVESLTPSLLKRGKKPPPTSPKKLKKVMI